VDFGSFVTQRLDDQRFFRAWHLAPYEFRGIDHFLVRLRHKSAFSRSRSFIRLACGACSAQLRHWVGDKICLASATDQTEKGPQERGFTFWESPVLTHRTSLVSAKQ
jgi:hypothetical protein